MNLKFCKSLHVFAPFLRNCLLSWFTSFQTELSINTGCLVKQLLFTWHIKRKSNFLKNTLYLLQTSESVANDKIVQKLQSC